MRACRPPAARREYPGPRSNSPPPDRLAMVVELQGNADDVVSLLLEQGGRDGGNRRHRTSRQLRAAGVDADRACRYAAGWDWPWRSFRLRRHGAEQIGLPRWSSGTMAAAAGTIKANAVGQQSKPVMTALVCAPSRVLCAQRSSSGNGNRLPSFPSTSVSAWHPFSPIPPGPVARNEPVLKNSQLRGKLTITIPNIDPSVRQVFT